jgi:hypothetical protein
MGRANASPMTVSDEAIRVPGKDMDCFASLAMTEIGLNPTPPYARRPR